MQPLEKSLRNRLECTLTDARTIAETAAKAALDQHSVVEAAPW
jgi:NAD+--asparagine ADP-ribosyltransferase